MFDESRRTYEHFRRNVLLLPSSRKPHAAHPTDRATIDHDIPKCRMVASVIKNNLVLACHDCNLHKGDMTGNEFIQFRRDRKFPASYIEFLEARLAGKLRL